MKYADDVVQYVKDFVAPFVGAWIEIFFCQFLYVREKVAPFVGAWIEIAWLHLAAKQSVHRSLCESVDCNKIDQTVEIDFCIDFFVKMWIEIPIL